MVEQSLDEIDAGLDQTVLMNLKKNIDKKLHRGDKPLSFLATVYKQDKYFDNHKLLFKAESESASVLDLSLIVVAVDWSMTHSNMCYLKYL